MDPSPSSEHRSLSPSGIHEESGLHTPQSNETGTSTPTLLDSKRSSASLDESALTQLSRGTSNHENIEPHSTSTAPRQSWTIPLLHRQVFKCALAYFVATLFTFVPVLSRLVVNICSIRDTPSPFPSVGAHMAATVVIYFSPAASIGGMLEADIYCLIGIIFSALVCASSMWFRELVPSSFGDVFVVLWVGVWMGVVRWTKAKMNTGACNVACAMTSIILFSVIVMDGGSAYLLQVTFVAFAGAFVSNVVCFLIWPTSASAGVLKDMNKTLDACSDLISALPSFFLMEKPLHQSGLIIPAKLMDVYNKRLSSLKMHLGDARNEWALCGAKERGGAYDDAVTCLGKLTRHLSRLESSTTLQYDIMLRQGLGSGDESDVRGIYAATFGHYMQDLGVPLKTVTAVCSRSLQRLQELNQTQEFDEIKEDIECALIDLEQTSDRAVLGSYKSRRQKTYQSPLYKAGKSSSLIAWGPNEDGDEDQALCLVYFFVFTLEEFARDLIHFVDAMSVVNNTQQSKKYFWQTILSKQPRSAQITGRRIASSSTLVGSDDHSSKPEPTQLDVLLTPKPSVIKRLRRFVWSIVLRMRQPDIVYAFKTAVATSLLAAPCFIDATRPWFTQYRGEWALVSFFIVTSPTLGATQSVSLDRFLGTILGTIAAAGSYSAFPADPVALSIFGFCFAIPCFNIMINKPRHLLKARFALISYNLACLYCYNLRHKPILMSGLALRRLVSVLAGIVWALVVSRYWSAKEARIELGEFLSEFCVGTGGLYAQLVSFNSLATDSRPTVSCCDPNVTNRSVEPIESSQLDTTNRVDIFAKECTDMELNLEKKMAKLRGLLAQTFHEPHFRDPFPHNVYRSILVSLERINDRLQTMRCISSREEWCTSIRHDFYTALSKERRALSGNIILSFSILAAAFKVKTPVSSYLPPAEESRERLFDAFKCHGIHNVNGSSLRLFFAYALAIQGVTQELENIGHMLQDSFGQTFGGFDELFKEAKSLVDV